jgi:hypothetical protein
MGSNLRTQNESTSQNYSLFLVPKVWALPFVNITVPEAKEVEEVISVETDYSIPYSKQNMEKIKNLGLQVDGRIKFFITLFYSAAGFNSALPNRTENALHHIKTVSYFVISVPAGIG